MKINAIKRLAVLAVSVSAFALAAPAQSDEFKGFHGGLNEALGHQYDAQSHGYDRLPQVRVRTHRVPNTPANYLRNWHRIALDATALDHTPVPAGDTRVFGEQFGPTRTSRAESIVHIAMFDALNAIDHKYQGYTGLEAVNKATSRRAAIAQAAHDTLTALYPSQTATFNEQLALDLDQLPDNKQKARGIQLGKQAAAAILALRTNDGSEIPEPVYGIDYLPPAGPGNWSQDPISLDPHALGLFWPDVKPFVMTSGNQFRLPPPPALNSPEYTAAFNEVKALGGDGIVTPTIRNEDQTIAGIFWAYDGTPSLCAPPRLYNQVTDKIASVMHTNNALKLARLYALVNLALGDAGIASWDSKWFYHLWRPIGGIRGADTDGNPDTEADPSFSPLGGQATNLSGPNFTPPFPSYPSGHATFGGSLFQMMRDFYGTDNITFDFTSDEFNGENFDNQGNVMPKITRHYANLSQAEEENGQSRIYLGIHWSFDKTGGISQGNNVANYVFNNTLTPLDNRNENNTDDSDFDD